MKKTTLYLLFIFIFSCNSFEDNKADIINLMINEVTYLSSDELEGRETGSEGELLAAKYISTKFEEYGLIGKGTDGFFHKFEASIKENPHSNTIKRKIEATNVVAYKDNQAKETIIIGAHYDHIGYGNFGSLYDGENEIHNGADDNASGVSIMMNLAKSLNKHNTLMFYIKIFLLSVYNFILVI